LEILHREMPQYLEQGKLRAKWVRSYVIPLIKRTWRGRYDLVNLEKDAPLRKEWRKKKDVSCLSL
jgi:hypothetical protein